MVAHSDEGAPAERVGSISSYKRRLGFNCSLRNKGSSTFQMELNRLPSGAAIR